jgi:MFS transporter, FHS family, L-fucose permease
LDDSTPERKSQGTSGILTIGLLFFIFGFVTWLNGPLITFVKLAFDLDDVSAFLVPMAFYLSYFFLSLPASAILKRTGMKQGMALGLYVSALGSALFGQFTTMREYSGALAGLFVTGAGLSLLQTASNPYVCILGPHESAARRIAVMGICHKFAGVIAPFVFAALVLKDIGTFDADIARAPSVAAREALLDAFAARVHGPYLLMALLLAFLGVGIARSNLPDIRPQIEEIASDVRDRRSIFAFRNLWLGVVCLFLYVGVEVMAGDAIGLYGAGFGLPISATRFFTSYTLFAMLIGYVVGLLVIPRMISQQSYLSLSAALGVLLSIGAYLTAGAVSVAFIASLGFANAMMWPAIFPLAIHGLGKHTETGSAFLIMAISGGALMPYTYGMLKQHVDFQLAYLLLAAPAYLYILYYGVSGYASERKNLISVSP